MKTAVQTAPGVTTVLQLADGNLTTATIQDCTPIAERTKLLQREGVHGSSEMKHAASLPYVIVEKYCNDNGITFQQFMNGREHIKRMLNDPSLSHFRIWPGKV